jgi:DnaK suppressor protein
MQKQELLSPLVDIEQTTVEDLDESQQKFPIDLKEQPRYSDAELNEFRKLILTKLEETIIDYELLTDTLSLHNDNGTNDTSPSFKLLEDAADVFSKEEAAKFLTRQHRFIQHLQDALIRIDNKTYGVCRATGKLISKERLRSVPHTTLSISAKQKQSN